MSSSGSGSGSIDTTRPALSCDDYKENLTLGLAPYEILNFVTPHDDRVWTERGDPWIITMGVFVGILSLAYLMLGTLCFILIFKKDCVRLPAKTFFAVYLMLGILGYTRALHLLLDPYGLFTFISEKFSKWIIVSRIFALSGFPSLVACCTIIIFTLLKIPQAKNGRNQWYHQWKYIIPIAVAPYVIAATAEVISYLVPYPALLSIVICEAFFALWGIIVCIAYLFAGVRLLAVVRTSKKRTMRTSASTPNTAPDADRQLQPQQQQQQQQQIQPKSNKPTDRQKTMRNRKTRNTTRKISIITYTSAVLGVFYSLLTGTNLVLVGILVFNDCLGWSKRGNSIIWLGLQVGTRITEVTLASVICYSITDVTIVYKFMKHILLCGGNCCCHRNSRQVVQQGNTSNTLVRNNLHSLHSKNTSEMCILTSVRQAEDVMVTDEMESSNRTQNSDVEAGIAPTEVAIEMHTEETQSPSQVVIQNEQALRSSMVDGGGITNPQVFMLNAHMDSATSIETGVTSLDSWSSPSRRTETRELHTILPSVASATDSNTLNDQSSLDTTGLKRQSPLLADVGPDSEETISLSSSSSSSEQNSLDERTAGTVNVTIVTVGGMSSVGTQTVKQRSIACQTESPKPVPKPRSLLPNKAPDKQRSRRKRLHDQQQLQKKDPSKSLLRKQTV